MTLQKENPVEVATNTGHISKTLRSNPTKLSKRMHRIVLALLDRPHSTRELIDIAPTTNVAQYVKDLRRGYSLSIPCEHIPFVTIDSQPSWYGRYHLTDDDRKKLQDSFGGGASL